MPNARPEPGCRDTVVTDRLADSLQARRGCGEFQISCCVVARNKRGLGQILEVGHYALMVRRAGFAGRKPPLRFTSTAMALAQRVGAGHARELFGKCVLALFNPHHLQSRTLNTALGQVDLICELGDAVASRRVARTSTDERRVWLVPSAVEDPESPVAGFVDPDLRRTFTTADTA